MPGGAIAYTRPVPESGPAKTMLQIPPTKLPRVGTTIFTVMSQMAAEHGAVNLGQGFPDFPVPQRLVEELDAAMRAGHNQYSPMTGAAVLREAIAGPSRQPDWSDARLLEAFWFDDDARGREERSQQPRPRGLTMTRAMRARCWICLMQ